MNPGDLVMIAKDSQRPQDADSIGLLYRNASGALMIIWNDEPEHEELDLYSDFDLEIVSEVLYE